MKEPYIEYKLDNENSQSAPSRQPLFETRDGGAPLCVAQNSLIIIAVIFITVNQIGVLVIKHFY
jgi:hypothetical protein